MLSNGGYDGLGSLRTQEMETAAEYFGFREHRVVDDANLQDGPDEAWDIDIIHDYIQDYAQQHKIDTIVTFDDGGVSYHPNHISVYKGAMKYFEMAEVGKRVNLMTLYTVHPIRKYLAFLDIYSSRNDHVNFYNYSPFEAVYAMSLHSSQFVWYRKLFMWFARYPYYNSFIYFPKF